MLVIKVKTNYRRHISGAFNPVNIYLFKVLTETLEQCVKYIQS